MPLALNDLPDDLQLVQRASRGDQPALRCLLLRHHDSLLQLIRGSFPHDLRSVADPEDVLQVSLAEIVDRLADFQPQSSDAVGAWFRRIADRNLTDLIRFHRAAKRGGSKRLGDVAAAEAGEDTHLSLIFQHALTPSRAVAAEEAVAALHVALEQLPADYQDVIRLRYFEQQSLAQTAALMNRTEESVRGISYRAICQLRQIMGRFSRYFSRS